MSVQLALIQDKPKELLTVPIDQLTLSEFNPRRTRPDEDIDKLAERISRNGFEVTRAMWAYRNGSGYKVFAGGTRLEAAKRAALNEVPIVLYDDLTEDDIVRLAQQDNEDDEYHRELTCVDTWLDYKALYEKWGYGSQERIKNAKNINARTLVTLRLALADLPQSVLDIFVKKGFLKESHATEINELSNFDNLSLYITREQAMLEVIETVLKKSPTNPTATQFKEAVEKMNDLLELVTGYYNQLDSDWGEKFLKKLGKTRSTDTIQKRYNEIVSQIAIERKRLEDEAKAKATEAEQLRIKAEREATEQAYIRAIMNRLVHGDVVTEIDKAPNNIKLILTDPPYGQDFQSNRRVQTTKADKIEGDEDADKATDLLLAVLTILFDKMSDDSTAFVFSSQIYEPEFRETVKKAGFNYRNTYIWNKSNHGSGDLERTHSPKHECIIHAVKGDPKFHEDAKRPDSVLAGNEFLEGEHPTKKPIDLLKLLIETWSGEHDLVIDPFAGIGSTPVAALQANRQFWACEINQSYHTTMTDIILKMVKNGG